MKKVILAGLGCAMLAACGGGGTVTPQPQMFKPVQAHQGDAGGELELNSAGDRIKVDIAGITATLDTGTVASAGTFVGGSQSGTETVRAFVSETGQSRAGVAYLRDGADPQVLTAQFARKGDTTVPTTGSATVSGDYVGILTVNNAVSGRITGDARLTASFGSETVRGRITNRQYGNISTGNVSASVTVDDIVLEETGFNANGRFGGTASGGAFSTNSFTGTANSGNFEGLIAGRDGDEIVGGVRINSTYAGSSFTEQGAFAAGH